MDDQIKEIRNMSQAAHNRSVEASIKVDTSIDAIKGLGDALQNHVNKCDAKNNWILVTVVSIAAMLVVDKLGWIPMGV